MADHHDEEAACPKCGGTITFTLWENLVAEKYPEAAEKLMRGELFAYECPHCHATGNGYYPLRFTDMTAKVMVDYPATTDLRVAGEMVNEFREKQKLFAETGFPLDYDYRVVIDPNALVEKAQIFAAGRDDRVIEAVKCFMTDAFLAENRFYRKVQLRFLKGSPEHSFYVLGTEGEVLTRILLDMDYYAMVRDVMKLDEIDEAVVNEAWADDYIRSHIEDFQ